MAPFINPCGIQFPLWVYPVFLLQNEDTTMIRDYEFELWLDKIQQPFYLNLEAELDAMAKNLGGE